MGLIKLSLKAHISVFIFLLVVFAFQFEVIKPTETLLLPLDVLDADRASYFFLPHGVKVLIGFLLGLVSLPVVFLAQVVGALLHFDMEPSIALLAAAFGTIAVYVPVLLLNYMLAQPLGGSVPAKHHQIGYFRVYMALVVMSTFLHATLHSAVFHYENSISLPFKYLVGDVVGASFVFGVALLFRHYIAKKLVEMSRG